MPEKNQDYDAVMRSTVNLPDAKLLLAGYLNIRDLLGYDFKWIVQQSRQTTGATYAVAVGRGGGLAGRRLLDRRRVDLDPV